MTMVFDMMVVLCLILIVVVSGLHIPNDALKTRRVTALGYRAESLWEMIPFAVTADVADFGCDIASEEMPLLRDVNLKGGDYFVGENIPVVSEKCELYEIFHVDDYRKQQPLIMKLSDQVTNIDVEYEVYTTISDRLAYNEKDLFVQIYEKVENLQGGKSALIMEKGEDNLRFHVGRKGRYTGEALKSAFENVIRIVDALHQKGMIWTEIKAENFIVTVDGKIKGIDLESVIYKDNFLQMYTPEACPPEFPMESLYVCLPEIKPDYSFDIWGLGILLFEIATGKPFYDGGLTDVDFIKERLYNTVAIGKYLDTELCLVHPQARDIIKKCLAIDPNARSSCQELLRDPFFSSINQEMLRGFVNPTTHAQQVQATPQVWSPFPQSIGNQIEGRQCTVLDVNLSDRLHAVLDAIIFHTKHNPRVLRAFLEIPCWTENYDPSTTLEAYLLQGQLRLAKRMEAVLAGIDIVSKSDPGVARDLLFIVYQTPAHPVSTFEFLSTQKVPTVTLNV